MTQITKAQERTIAALFLLSKTWGPDSWHLRYEIGRMVFGTARGIGRTTMAKLASLGMVEHESDDAMRLVNDGICRCGCDRWRLTQKGREAMNGKKIVAGHWWKNY